MPSLEYLWGIILVIAVLFTLASGITATLILHTKKMKESEIKFRLLFDRVLTPIVLIDQEFCIKDANRASYKLLDYSNKELQGLRLEKLVSSKDWSVLSDELSRCLATGIDYSGEGRLIAKNGAMVQVEISGTSHVSNGDTFFLMSFRDIGAHKRTEEALKQKNAALNEILAHLEEEKVKFKQQVAETIDQSLMPTLGKLVNHDGTVSKTNYDALRDNLSEMAASAGGMLHTYRKLTPREVEICNLLKSGASSKDVAETLNIAIATVNKHRERIRRKLVINKKEINLGTYLREK